MSGFQAEVTTTSSSESVTLPFVTGYTYNCTVDWGDGSPPVSVTAWDDADATHVYATANSYTIEITGSCPAWSVNNTHSSRLQWTARVYGGDAVDFDGWQDITGGWFGCYNLGSLGSGSIVSDGLTLLNNTFRNVGISTAGVSLPAGLLDDMAGVTTMTSTFLSANLTGGIPSGFFDACTDVTSSLRCMQNCSGLTGETPSLLLAAMVNNTVFNYFLKGCTGLQIRSDLFYLDADKYTRFFNQSPDFSYIFQDCGTTLTTSSVPDLWSCDFGSGTPTHLAWIDGHSANTLTNWYEIPPDWDGPDTKQVIVSDSESPASAAESETKQRNKVEADSQSPSSSGTCGAILRNTFSGSISSPSSLYESSARVLNEASSTYESPSSVVSVSTKMRNAVSVSSSVAPSSEIDALGKLIQLASAAVQSPASLCFGVLNQVHTVNSITSATIFSPGSLVRGYQNPFLDEQIIPLVETPDGFELVRDKIAEILAKETLLQQSQAQTAGYDPDNWKFLVYAERNRPWEIYRDGGETTPIVNIWYDTDSFDRATSNSEDRQKTTSIYHIDCFAYAASKQTEGGHTTGDESAAKAAHRIGRLVRRILMHPKYESFGFSDEENPIWHRWVTSRLAFQPTSSSGPIQNVMGFRIDLEVQHNECIDLYPEVNLEQIMIQLFHEPDDQVRAELFYREV